jgi:hypothetical protein
MLIFAPCKTRVNADDRRNRCHVIVRIAYGRASVLRVRYVVSATCGGV